MPTADSNLRSHGTAVEFYGASLGQWVVLVALTVALPSGDLLIKTLDALHTDIRHIVLYTDITCAILIMSHQEENSDFIINKIYTVCFRCYAVILWWVCW